MDRWNTDIQEEARRVLLLEKQREREEAERQKAAEATAMAERERRLQEERTLLIQREIEARLLAEKMVLEEEARRIAQEKEAALKAELERLRNRTPLEVLQDEVVDLREQLATALAEVDAMREKAEAEMKAVAEKAVEDAKAAVQAAIPSTPKLSEELLLKEWTTLVEWKAVQKELEAIQSQWLSNERVLFKNPEYMASYGNYTGSSKVAYPVDAIMEDIMKAIKTMEEIKSLRLLNRPITKKNLDEIQAQRDFLNSYAQNESQWASYKSGGGVVPIPYFPAYMGLKHLTWDQVVSRKADVHTQWNTANNTHNQSMATISCGQQNIMTNEITVWNGSQENTALMKRVNDIHSVYTSCVSLRATLQRVNEKELELVTLERTLNNHLGTEDLETAYRNAVKAVRCARSA